MSYSDKRQTPSSLMLDNGRFFSEAIMKCTRRVALLVFLFFVSCSKDDESPFVPEVLVENNLIASFTKSDLTTFIGGTVLPFPTREIKYDVDIYIVTYTTKYKNESIIASGLVALPKTSDPSAMLSFQHGTIAAHNEAPTEVPASDFIMKFYAAISTSGIITVIPDYIGFGSSKSVLHPYYVETATADAVVDNIRAARELALTKKLSLTNRLLLAGYSQGGYATMAAHKRIEEVGGSIDGMELIASFPASGGYDIKGVQEYFFGLQTYDQPFFLAYVAAAYKQTYDWERDLTFFFKEPYASRIPILFDGSNSGDKINAQLTQNIADLVQDDFLKNIDSNSEYNFIVTAFEENSLTDWVPTIPMYMYHGQSDITVPYNNSVTTFDHFIKAGASPSIVTFTPIPFGTHSSGVGPYLVDLINKVLTLK